MDRARRFWLAIVVALAPRLASAQTVSDQDKALSTQLFDEGHALLTQGKVPEACRKLEESRRLYSLPGTLLNLAACHEREGLTASAMAEFLEARALAQRDGKKDRVAFADEHLKTLMQRLSMLVVVVPPEVDSPSLTVMRDGVAIGRAVWGTRIPVDPGPHVVEASAPGKTLEHLDVNVGPDADVQTVTLTPLADASPAVTPPAPAPPSTSPTSAPTPPPSTEPPPPPAQHGLSTRRTWALASSGVGVLALGAGTVAGAIALSKHNASGATCTTNPCSTTSEGLNNDAKLAADVSTVTFIVGAVGLGVGAFLWFCDVAVTPGIGSVAVSGRF